MPIICLSRSDKERMKGLHQNILQGNWYIYHVQKNKFKCFKAVSNLFSKTVTCLFREKVHMIDKVLVEGPLKIMKLKCKRTNYVNLYNKVIGMLRYSATLTTKFLFLQHLIFFTKFTTKLIISLMRWKIE